MDLRIPAIILLFLAGPSPARASSCIRDLQHYLGTEEGVLDPARSASGDRYYKLHPDHEVYRVVPRNTPDASYVVKYYRSAEDLSNDLRGLAILRNNPGFEVAAASKGREPATMVLKDTRGKSLGSLLSDPAIPEGTRAALRQEYTRRLRELETFLRDHYDIETLRPTESAGRLPGFMARVHDPRTGKSIKLWMRPDQVVIPSWPSGQSSAAPVGSLRMMIIDPY